MVYRSRPYLLNIFLLLIALAFSIAVGPVFIPPGTFLRLLAQALPGTSSFANLPAAELAETFTTILFEIRLPHAVLIALSGAALAGSGAVYQGL